MYNKIIAKHNRMYLHKKSQYVIENIYMTTVFDLLFQWTHMYLHALNLLTYNTINVLFIKWTLI
jgi:hypothetical protein